jgi:hypothetical protein
LDSVSDHHKRNTQWNHVGPDIAVAFLAHGTQVFRVVYFVVCQSVFVPSLNADKMPDLQRTKPATQFTFSASPKQHGFSCCPGDSFVCAFQTSGLFSHFLF